MPITYTYTYAHTYAVETMRLMHVKVALAFVPGY